MKQLISREMVNLQPAMVPEWKKKWSGVKRSSSAFPVVIQQKSANGVEQGYDKVRCPIAMIALRCF